MERETGQQAKNPSIPTTHPPSKNVNAGPGQLLGPLGSGRLQNRRAVDRVDHRKPRVSLPPQTSPHRACSSPALHQRGRARFNRAETVGGGSPTAPGAGDRRLVSVSVRSRIRNTVTPFPAQSNYISHNEQSSLSLFFEMLPCYQPHS